MKKKLITPVFLAGYAFIPLTMQSFADNIESPFEETAGDDLPQQIIEGPMQVPDRKLDLNEEVGRSPSNRNVVSPPKPTFKSEEKESRPLIWELSLGLNYTRLKTFGDYTHWKIDPSTQATIQRRLENLPFQFGFRLFAVSGQGTINQSTGNFGFLYFGPSAGLVSINNNLQKSFDVGISFVKINGYLQTGPEQAEFSRAPGVRSDPPGLWASARYGKMLGGALTNGFTLGIQWSQKKIYAWLGLFTSAWY
jgi:hypothetical protein